MTVFFRTLDGSFCAGTIIERFSNSVLVDVLSIDHERVAGHVAWIVDTSNLLPDEDSIPCTN